MTRLPPTFASLRHRNFRYYFIGQAVSVTGEWMQRIGQAWLVLELTDSPTLLGLTAALQHLPIMLIGPWGGLAADRIDKRRLMIWTHTIAGVLAAGLGLLVATERVRLWMVLAFAVAFGAASAFDRPARQALVSEMVPPAQLGNAVTLYSIVFNSGKAVGPALAGVLIATAGLAWSFLVNAASYVAVLVALLVVRQAELNAPAQVVPARGQLREAAVYVLRTPSLAGPLFLMAVAGTLAYEWTVTLPLLARYTFGGDAQTYGTMLSAMGIGAVGGGLVLAGWLSPTLPVFFGTAWAFGGLLLLTAASPRLGGVIVVLVGLGAASLALRATATAMLQLNAAPEMRGRVMALLSMALMGSSPLGAPLLGWIGEAAGARAALALGGVGTLLATVLAMWHVRRALSAARA